MRFWTFFLWILLFCSHLGFAQNLKFKTYTVENGLSNNSINTIEVDKDGVLWIGTWDGINYYDGHRFATFKHIPNDSTSIPNNFIDSIVKDIYQNVWVLSIGSDVSLSNGNGTFTNFKFNQRVNHIGLSKNKTILVQVGKQFYTYVKNQFIPCNSCNFYEVEAQWKEVFHQYFPQVQWVAHLKDSQGNLWIGSRKDGLFYIPATKILDLKKSDIQNYRNDPYQKFSLQSNEIIEIREDDFGNIWIGTKDGGLSRVYKNSESVFYVTNHPQENPYLPNEAIRAITVDFQDQIWLGYYSEGLFIRKKGKAVFNQILIPKAIENPEWNKIRSLYTASDGSVFGGTYAGIFRFKNGKFTFFQAQDYALFPHNRTYAFYETKDQQLYVACWGGVALLDLKTNEFLPFDGQSKLNTYHIRDIIKIGNQLYMATEKSGLILLENGRASKINKANNSPENSIYTLWYDDANDLLWCGTLDGIIIYSIKQKKIIKKITEGNGLKSHLIYGIIGYDNQVWISTTDGLLVIDKNTFDTFIYPGQEGLQAAEFSEGAYFMDHKHIIYFGGVKGLNYFNPDNIDLKEDVPILKIYIDKKRRDREYSKAYFSNDVTYTIDPTFYSISNGNQIKYKLEGYDDKWHSTNYDKKHITYRNLPAGNYIFKVKNARKPQEINQYSLHIQKPFWQSIYFYLILLILIILLIAILLIAIRKKQLKREKELEEKIAERVKEISIQKQQISLKNEELIEKNLKISSQKEALQQLHAKLKTESMEMDKFNAYLVKEYKNPLSKIRHQLETISSDHAQKIQIEVNGLLNKILAVNYLSNIDNNYTLQKSVIELEKATENILNEITPKLENAQIKFNIIKNTQELWVLMDVLCYKLFLKYIFTDISKYPDPQGILDITYEINPNKISFIILWNNKLLNKNLYYIQHYSPYYQACKTIADLLSIDLVMIKEADQSGFHISFEPETVTVEKNEHTKLNWVHLELEPKIDKNKATLLVWANEIDVLVINQLLPTEAYNIILEKDKNLLLSVFKSLKVQMFIIYNQDLNQDVYKITTKLNNKHPDIKILYLSDDISYQLEHQIIEMGMDDIIQLPANKVYIDNKIQKLLTYQKSSHSNQNIYDTLNQIFQEKVDNQNEKLIRNALKIIQQRMSDSNFNVKELCDELDISTIKCYRVFKEVLDIPPSDFILNIKMNKAESLLLNSSLNIAEIAYETGFADPKYFSKVFKKTFGKSPKKYKFDKIES